LLVRALISALLLTLATVPGTAAGFAVDLSGQPITRLAPAGSRALVLFFAASDCPISNRYIPEIQKLATEFATSGVSIWFVYPNPGDNTKIVGAHNVEYAITARTALDTNQTLVKMAHVDMTPEAAVFIPNGDQWREVYRGRIDDRYIDLGDQRPAAMHHDLEEAIRAVLKNQPVPKPGGPAVGCSIIPLHP
jgi:AhpC/TSA family